MKRHPYLVRHHHHPVTAYVAILALILCAVVLLATPAKGQDPGLIPPLVIERCDQHAGTGECPAIPVPARPGFAG